MNQIARLLPHMTADDFLSWAGDGSGRKFQLIDGEFCPVSPASDTHGTIHSNLHYLLVSAIRSSASGLRVVIEGAVIPGLNASMNVRVPDLVVTASPNMRGQQTVPDPVLMIEILSPGNQDDTRDNVRAYATLPSVQELAVVHSTRALIEVHRRGTDGAWLPDPEYVGLGDRLRLLSVSLDCRVEDAYELTWLLPST